ncbi:MAG: hypothetical protein R3F34_05810 [Planctomycetota bacterium]
MKSPLLVDVLPDFALELQSLLVGEGEDSLAQSVPRLSIVDRCRCGDDFCSTFYTAPRPSGAYGPGLRNLDLPAREGMLILDVVDDEISGIEVLYRPEIQLVVHGLLP